MRSFTLGAALLATLVASRPATAVSYSTDRSFQYPGQTVANSGRGIAVSADGSRLFAISRGATSVIHVLDTATGASAESITPVAAAVSDLALSPDGTTVYIARRVTSTTGAIDAAPSAGGTATDIPAFSALAGPALALAATASGADTLLGVATTDGFEVWKLSAGAWSFVADRAIPSASTHTVTVGQTAAGPAFFVLSPSTLVSDAMRVFGLDGAPKTVIWDETPPTVGNGYLFVSATAAVVGGDNSVFIAGETVDGVGNPRATIFRYGTDGRYRNDGFGYDLSASAPLSALEPVSNSSGSFAPMALAGMTAYVGGVLPSGSYAGLPQLIQVKLDAGIPPPGSIGGTVRTVFPPSSLPLPGATVFQDGVDAAALTNAEGKYELGSVTPGPQRRVGAFQPGYAAVSRTVSLPSGQSLVVDFDLSSLVALYRTWPLTGASPSVDGIIAVDEYPGTPVPLYVTGTGQRAPEAVAGLTRLAWDADAYYVAVSAEEPSLAFNASTSLPDQVTMLTRDDNVQIALDPPHRHDVPGAAPNLYQFAVSVPAPGTGNPVKLERKVNADGSTASDVPAEGWTAAIGYTATGWVVEARIPFATLGVSPFVPAADTVWGVLVSRNRPQFADVGQGHTDGLPARYTISPTQAVSLADSRTWADTVFLGQPPGVAGDVNRNGAVDIQDAALALRIAGGMPFGDSTASYEVERALALLQGDVWPKGAPDGRLSIEDALRIARAAAGNDTLP